MFAHHEPWKVNAYERNLEPRIVQTFAAEVDLWVRKFLPKFYMSKPVVLCHSCGASCTVHTGSPTLAVHSASTLLFHQVSPTPKTRLVTSNEEYQTYSRTYTHTNRSQPRKWVNLPLATAIMITR